MNIDNITKENVLLYAAKVYDKPHMIQAEFKDDFRRIQYVKRLITKYKSGKPLKIDLIINHLVVFFNVFGIDAGSRILFCCIAEKDWPVVVPFIVYLNYLQKFVMGVNGQDIYTDTIQMDYDVITEIRKFKWPTE